MEEQQIVKQRPSDTENTKKPVFGTISLTWMYRDKVENYEFMFIV